MTEQLLVLLYGQIAGTLTRDGSGQDASFTYDRDYLYAGLPALSSRLPLQEAPYPPQRVIPFLRGLLPESRDALQVWGEQLRVDPSDTFGLLAQMGWDCPGAVQFCVPAQLQMLTRRAGEYERVTDAQIADRLRSLAERPASWSMRDEHWSLAGQQEKFAIAYRDGGWALAHGSAATTHIVKPGIRSLYHQALVEYLTMQAAAAAGLDVARTQFLGFEDQWAIVIERFDRAFGADGSVQRLHQEDFCQALGRLPERKYEANGGPGLRDMAGLVQRQSTSVHDDRLALADFAAVNLVAGAPDGHAKNISLLRTHGGNWVAALYDVASGLAYERSDVERSVAVSIGGERFVSRIRGRQWDKAAQVLGLDGQAYRERVSRMAAVFPDGFAHAAGRLGDAPGVDEVLARVGPRLRQHCGRIVDQL